MKFVLILICSVLCSLVLSSVGLASPVFSYKCDPNDDSAHTEPILLNINDNGGQYFFGQDKEPCTIKFKDVEKSGVQVVYTVTCSNADVAFIVDKEMLAGGKQLGNGVLGGAAQIDTYFEGAHYPSYYSCIRAR